MNGPDGKTWITPNVVASADTGNAVWWLPGGMDWHSQDINAN